MHRIPPMALVLLLALASTGAAWGVAVLFDAPAAEPEQAAAGEIRIVSLSPAMTETLFAIGAGDRVVGISTYCDYPPEALTLPRAGTVLTPDYETIARLDPTCVVGDRMAGVPEQELASAAPLRLLDWLTLEEMVSSIQELGRLSGHEAEASRLAAHLDDALSVAPPEDAPRLLVVIGGVPGKLDEVWFIRPNSLQGLALHAAGARNIVENDVVGPPSLSVERVLELDPDAVVVLMPGPDDDPEVLAQIRRDWMNLTPLRAVERGAVFVRRGPALLSSGPRVLEVVEVLREIVSELRRRP